MRLKIFIAVSALLIVLGVFLFEDSIMEPDMNDPVLQALTAQLATQGYEVISVESTWLGRFKIEAHSDSMEREIVVAPGAGTFLRDDISPLEEDDTDDD